MKSAGTAIALITGGSRVLGRNIALDVLFILGGALVLWQAFETSRELR